MDLKREACATEVVRFMVRVDLEVRSHSQQGLDQECDRIHNMG
ncbi:hypothetical protein [Calothrix sp. PCC 6303]|nr:hypothetical protein [Calothrix sp. PCC 6303]